MARVMEALRSEEMQARIAGRTAELVAVRRGEALAAIEAERRERVAAAGRKEEARLQEAQHIQLILQVPPPPRPSGLRARSPASQGAAQLARARSPRRPCVIRRVCVFPLVSLRVFSLVSLRAHPVRAPSSHTQFAHTQFATPIPARRRRTSGKCSRRRAGARRATRARS